MDRLTVPTPYPPNPIIYEMASDVTIRLKGHGAYKGRPGALSALARRAPGFTPDQYEAVLDLLGRVYDRAVEVIQVHRRERPDKTSRFAELEDIDVGSCLRELERIEPGVATDAKRAILNWVILWHYLK